MRKPLPCGTYAAYQRHKKAGEKACAACLAANAAYRREHFRDNPRAYQRELDRNSAQQRALWRLARRHRAEFRALVEEELR